MKKNEVVNFSIRISPELHNEIKKEAKEINSSINSMILFLIKLGLKVYKGNISIQIQSVCRKVCKLNQL